MHLQRERKYMKEKVLQAVFAEDINRIRYSQQNSVALVWCHKMKYRACIIHLVAFLIKSLSFYDLTLMNTQKCCNKLLKKSHHYQSKYKNHLKLFCGESKCQLLKWHRRTEHCSKCVLKCCLLITFILMPKGFLKAASSLDTCTLITEYVTGWQEISAFLIIIIITVVGFFS